MTLLRCVYSKAEMEVERRKAEEEERKRKEIEKAKEVWLLYRYLLMTSPFNDITFIMTSPLY